MSHKYKLLILFLTIPLLLLSQNDKNYFKHYFGGSSAGGFSMMPHLSLDKPIVLGGQWTGAFVYEVKRVNFVFSTGLEFSYKNYSMKMKDYHIQQTIIDTQDSLYIHDYYFTERKDNATSFALQLPLLFGYEDYNGFYFLTGLKFNVLLQSQTNASAKVTTIGTYDRYIDSFHDMPNHALVTNLPIRDIDKGIVRNVDLLFVAESGYSYRFNSGGPGIENANKESIFRVAFYLEYSFLNSYKACDNLLYKISDELPINYDAIQMNHIYLTRWDKLSYIQNLSVGCKLTYLFNVSMKKCDHCIRQKQPKYKTRRYCTRCIRIKR